MSDFPHFNVFCEATCIKVWGKPDRRTKKELRWNGDDSYGYRTFNLKANLVGCWPATRRFDPRTCGVRQG